MCGDNVPFCHARVIPRARKFLSSYGLIEMNSNRRDADIKFNGGKEAARGRAVTASKAESLRVPFAFFH